jgi:hypothetical protein
MNPVARMTKEGLPSRAQVQRGASGAAWIAALLIAGCVGDSAPGPDSAPGDDALLSASSVPVASIEAEAGSIVSPMVKMGTFIRTASLAGEASYSVELPASGTYRIEFLVHAPDGQSDSLFFSADGGSTSTLSFYAVSGRSGFVWDTSAAAVVRAALSKGTHTFKISGREANADIDAFRIICESLASPSAPAPDSSCLAPSLSSAILIEAESGSIVSPMVKMGTFIRTASLAGEASYGVETPASGTYRIEFLVHAPDGGSDSILFSADGCRASRSLRLASQASEAPRRLRLFRLGACLPRRHAPGRQLWACALALKRKALGGGGEKQRPRNVVATTGAAGRARGSRTRHTLYALRRAVGHGRAGRGAAARLPLLAL